MKKTESIAEKIMDSIEISDYYNPNLITTLENQKVIFKNKVLAFLEMKGSIDRMKKGIESVLNNLNLFSLIEQEKIKLNIEKMRSPISKLDDVHSLQQCYDINDSDMALWYHVALERHKFNSFEEAGDIFTLLITLNANVSSYWLGLGGSEQM
jgi:hypothetical protein